MPKFLVTATEVIFYRGVVEADSREALDEIDVDEMDLSEYDSEAMEIQLVEEV